VREGNETSALKGPIGRCVFRTAACGRHSAHVIAFALQLLDKIRGEAALAIGLIDLHIDIGVWGVVVKCEPTPAYRNAILFECPVVTANTSSRAVSEEFVTGQIRESAADRQLGFLNGAQRGLNDLVSPEEVLKGKDTDGESLHNSSLHS
jgi:hypothetical protein